jgi:hypothetical protein
VYKPAQKDAATSDDNPPLMSVKALGLLATEKLFKSAGKWFEFL